MTHWLFLFFFFLQKSFNKIHVSGRWPCLPPGILSLLHRYLSQSEKHGFRAVPAFSLTPSPVVSTQFVQVNTALKDMRLLG